MRKIWLSVSLVLVLGMLMGCGQLVEMPELSEEETELVTEYAAGLMIKYDSKYSGSILNDENLAKEKEKEAADREKRRAYEEAAARYLEKTAANQEDSAGPESSASSEVAAPVTENYIDNIASFYGIDGIQVGYAGYSLTYSYPESGDMLMAMDATPGRQLLVLKFDVTNISGVDTNFDMFYRQPGFSVSVNGERRIHNQATLLLDDMAAYAGNIMAGQTIPMVLVFEVSDSISVIDSMTLKVVGDSGSGTVLLQ